MICGKNVVIVLETGTDKTQIILLTIDQWLQVPALKRARFLITAPTQLLLEQHYHRFFQFRHWQEEQVILFKDTSRDKREIAYESPRTRVIISTPHCIRNDIENWVIPPNYFNLIFIDEFHCEASKDDEKTGYLTAAVNLTEYCSPHAQIIGLTATPGNAQEREQRKKLLHFQCCLAFFSCSLSFCSCLSFLLIELSTSFLFVLVLI